MESFVALSSMDKVRLRSGLHCIWCGVKRNEMQVHDSPEGTLSSWKKVWIVSRSHRYCYMRWVHQLRLQYNVSACCTCGGALQWSCADNFFVCCPTPIVFDDISVVLESHIYRSQPGHAFYTRFTSMVCKACGNGINPSLQSMFASRSHRHILGICQISSMSYMA